MPLSSAESLRLVDLVYETAEDEALWPHLFDAYREFIRAGIDMPAAAAMEGGEHALSELHLLVHMERASRFSKRLDQMRRAFDASKNILDCLPLAAFTVDAQGQVLEKNNLANQLLVDAGIVRCNALGKLVGKVAELSRVIHRLIERSCIEKRASHECFFARDSAMVITVFAAPTLVLHAPEIRACHLFIATETQVSEANELWLKMQFGLTPAEIRLVKHLASGWSLNKVAGHCSITIHTARNQLKAVFSKTGTSRQSELIRLVLSTPLNFFVDNTPPLVQEDFVETDESDFLSLRLADGRTLVYESFGSPLKPAVVYQHDAIFCWRWWRLLPKKVLANFPVRFIVVYRPNFASFDIPEHFSYLQWARDIEALLDRLAIRHFYSLSCSTGGPFAMACAYRMPTRCQALVLVNSVAPVASLSELDSIRPAMSRFILILARYSPELYQRFFGIVQRYMEKNAHSYLRHYISRWSEPDTRLIQDERVLNSIAYSVMRVMRYGGHGMIRDTILMMRDWGFPLQGIQVPTMIWSGGCDNAIPQSTTARLATIPHATLHVEKDVGHLMLYSHWPVIIHDMLRRTSALPHADVHWHCPTVT